MFLGLRHDLNYKKHSLTPRFDHYVVSTSAQKDRTATRSREMAARPRVVVLSEECPQVKHQSGYAKLS